MQSGKYQPAEAVNHGDRTIRPEARRGTSSRWQDRGTARVYELLGSSQPVLG